MSESKSAPTASAAGGMAILLLVSGLVTGITGTAPFADAVQQADRVAVGDEAPDFTLESIDGETYRLADARGDKKLVVVFFRGTW